MMTFAFRALAPLGLVFAAPLLVATPAPAQTGQTELAAVSAYIRAVKTMTADFTQTDRSGQSVGGKLTLKQPGRIRFQYAGSFPMLIVGDGKALTIIDYEVAQVQRWPIGSSPLSALIDPSRDIAKFSKVVPSYDPGVLTVEARDPKRPEFGTITLVFKRKAGAPAGLELYGWVATDAQRNRTSVRLSNQAYGVAVADSAFRWRDPRPQNRAGK